MASYYVYLMSSLPSLSFGAKPPMSFAGLIGRLEGMVSEEDIAVVKSVENLATSCVDVRNGTLRQWISFETMLRNELVMIRSSRRKEDPARYLREDGCPESVYAAHMAVNAYRKPSPLEAERTLDMDRWRRLEELSIGRYFDLDTLIIYACKLLMLEKWDRIKSADGRRMLEEALN